MRRILLAVARESLEIPVHLTTQIWNFKVFVLTSCRSSQKRECGLKSGRISFVNQCCWQKASSRTQAGLRSRICTAVRTVGTFHAKVLSLCIEFQHVYVRVLITRCVTFFSTFVAHHRNGCHRDNHPDMYRWPLTLFNALELMHVLISCLVRSRKCREWSCAAHGIAVE